MTRILLIGGGGHCISCIDVIEQSGDYEIVGIIDLPEKVGATILGYPIVGCDDDLDGLLKKTPNCLITVGQIKSATLRKRLYFNVLQANGCLCTVISPRAYVSCHAHIGQGTIVMHQAFVNAGVEIGENCIINSKANVEHEARIGNHCHVSTNAVVNGQVSIQDDTFIGSGSIIRNNSKICSNTVIGAGSLVLKNIDDAGTHTGKIH
jgi:sugar O-acyltransferase (sialic acid O-acetyltransferase NeuD family)